MPGDILNQSSNLWKEHNFICLYILSVPLLKYRRCIDIIWPVQYILDSPNTIGPHVGVLDCLKVDYFLATTSMCISRLNGKL